ncbi:MAG TPA: 2-amino-4-hydroxy-6-hydroxymethyldihydropteridine diphosphokinase [Actinomycetota bacterium]|jgi:2-amino-4-hydroxy-6-hydroxymethyldihydropteridine diphosphokinase|nr:2-amino-4-hydroxy-6-hydroxymethyldihydropteridine diphosphokinase [Actinomycetota bacterium]
MTRAYVGLGSNLGDRMATLDAAVRALDADLHTHVMAVSHVYETEPVGGPAQDPYLNAVAVLETDRSPRELLALLLATEAGLGRVRGERWGPRTLDLDLLLYDGPPIDSPELTVPHPRAKERAFVLVPLVDADPFARFPDGEAAVEALARLAPVSGVVPVSDLEV